MLESWIGLGLESLKVPALFLLFFVLAPKLQDMIEPAWTHVTCVLKALKLCILSACIWCAVFLFNNTQYIFWTAGGALFHATFFLFYSLHKFLKKNKKKSAVFLHSSERERESEFLHPSYYSVCALQTRLPQSSSVILHWNRLYWLLWSIVPFSSPPSSSSSWCYIMSGC